MTAESTMHAEVVKFEMAQPHVAVVTLNRPDARNAVSPELAQELDAVVARTESDEAIRVVVLTGDAQGVFCAGADLKAVAAGRGAQLWTERGFAGFTLADRNKPWIAAVEGKALAGGCELTLACDLIVASEGATFALPEVTRGLAALAGGLYRLPRVLPRNIALQMIMTGEPISAQLAHQHGMVTQLVAIGGAREAAIGIAARIAANAPVSVRESLQLARRAFAMSDEEAHLAGLEARSRIIATEDFKEGPRSFIEKRAPRWLGR